MFRKSLLSGFLATPAIRRFGTDIFSQPNLERTLSELNDPNIVYKFLGNYEVDGRARQSAVLIPLCLHKNKPSILFNLRSNKLTRHKGYPCFPGGVVDDTDQDRIHTALRETHEELGIQPADVKVIGSLPRFKMSRDNMEITAVIADIGDIDSLELDVNYNEVSVVFSRTIEELCDPKNNGYTSFRDAQGDVIYTTPVFLAGDYKIWGVTAMLLHMVLTRLIPEMYKKPLRPMNFRRNYRPRNEVTAV